MTRCCSSDDYGAADNEDAARRASSLYLAASHLYSRRGNVFEHGDEGVVTRYGWATLRATALQGLSLQPADKEVAEAGEFVYVMHIYAKMTLFLGSMCCSLLIFCFPESMLYVGNRGQGGVDSGPWWSIGCGGVCGMKSCLDAIDGVGFWARRSHSVSLVGRQGFAGWVWFF